MTIQAFKLARTVPVEQLEEGITRQILGFGEGLMTCRLTFAAGAVGALHSHPHSQTSYCESGHFLYRVGDSEAEIGPGDCVYVAPHLTHGIRCLEAGVIIDSFSPMRADFLGGN
jgi:quercetin dioxygenase-like cupin family protein